MDFVFAPICNRSPAREWWGHGRQKQTCRKMCRLSDNHETTLKGSTPKAKIALPEGHEIGCINFDLDCKDTKSPVVSWESCLHCGRILWWNPLNASVQDEDFPHRSITHTDENGDETLLPFFAQNRVKVMACFCWHLICLCDCCPRKHWPCGFPKTSFRRLLG